MVSDQDRRELYEALERRLGGGPAATMMELLPPVGWADVARQSDLVALRGELRGEMSELRGEMSELGGEMSELRGEMSALRSELKGEIAELRGEIKAQVPRLYAANLVSMIGVAGLVLAAGKLA